MSIGHVLVPILGRNPFQSKNLKTVVKPVRYALKGPQSKEQEC